MKKLRIILIVAGALLIAILLPLLLTGERRTMDDAARASAPGSFVALSEGVVHYELSGPAAGQPVVFINSFSVPMYQWDGLFQGLAAAGFRVLRYDPYGRGYSDRPRATYDRALFVRQLVGLLDAVGVTAPVDVVGVSMGGSLAAAFSAAHPERARRLVLMAPGPSSPPPAYYHILTLPGLGDWFFASFGGGFFASTQASDFHDPARIPRGYEERYREQTRYRGFSAAILSSLRSFYPPGYMDVYSQLGRQGKPVLLLWGTEDATVPFANNPQILERIPGAELHPIAEAGHMAHIEKQAEVQALIRAFLSR